MSDLAKKIRENKIVKQNEFVSRPPEYISAGSASLNILFSGKINGGIVKGKVMEIVAPSSLGKSLVGLRVVKNAQKDHGMTVLYVDTEFAYDEATAKKMKLDMDKFIPIQTNSIEEVQQAIIGTVSGLEQAERDLLLIVIDSWGNLVTSKTTEDAIAGKDTRDMTPAQKKNNLAKMLSGLKATVFVVNQTYENIMDMYNPLKPGGGNGLYFVCSSIVMGTSKAKDKDSDGDISGAIITAKTFKGRFCKEHSTLKYLIRHDGGIDPWYGIMDDALEGGYVIKPKNGWYTRPCVENDKNWRESEIWKSGGEFWSPVIKNTNFLEYIESLYRFSGEFVEEDLSAFDDFIKGDINEE